MDGCDFQTVARVSTMFGGRIRKGKKGKPVGAGSVRTGLGGVNTTIAMDTGTQPLHQIDGTHYIKPLQHMLAGFKNHDPATVKKLACHPDLPDFAVEWAYKEGSTPAQNAVGDLIIIAFYFLLRVGEYTTKARRKKRTRTKQFRDKDVTLFKRNNLGMLRALPRNASDEDIMTADAATLRISNQKSGVKGACVHHEAIPGAGLACPVRAIGRRIVHIRQHSKSGNAFLCAYWDKVGLGNVTDNNIRFAIKFAARMLDYEARGIPLDRVDTHSLHSGGACALALAGYKDREIMKMGRWSPTSTSFMEYIQQQLSTFSAGMSANMSKVAMFTNMEGAIDRTDTRTATIH